jgi:hypothetical protein
MIGNDEDTFQCSRDSTYFFQESVAKDTLLGDVHFEGGKEFLRPSDLGGNAHFQL